MNKAIYETIEESCNVLQLPFSSREFAELAEDNDMSEEAANAVALILEHIRQKKVANTIMALLRFSRLSLKNPKTFQNFDFSVLRGKNVEQIRSLQTLSAIYAHKTWPLLARQERERHILPRHLVMSVATTVSEHISLKCLSSATGLLQPDVLAKQRLY